MVKEIVRDTMFLSLPSQPATAMDGQVVEDLQDTLKANADRCVGLAANMIGVRKRILVFALGPTVIPMLNPIILKKSGTYETEEGCLSLDGQRKATRYRVIEVEYQDASMQKKRQTFEGFVAQIIQHEMDHFAGVLI